ncbi:MAG TPA: hypothetical protein VGE07_13760 [Herpetosiphonaceae bacterium]
MGSEESADRPAPPEQPRGRRSLRSGAARTRLAGLLDPRLWGSALLALGIVVLALRGDQRNAWRRAELARFEGRWRAALAGYQRLYDEGQREPALLLALANARGVRGETASLRPLLAPLVATLPPGEQRDPALLLAGWSQAERADEAGALANWAAVSSLGQGRANVLRAELALRRGELGEAAGLLNAAGSLDGAWHAWAGYRAAQLAVTHAPSATQELLGGLLLPGLPATVPPVNPARLAAGAAALAQIPPQPADSRLVALARLWASEGLGNAARALLLAVPADSQFAALAGDEAARLRWAAGDPAGAFDEIAALVERFPNVPALYRTQALLAAELERFDLASQALVSAEGLDPGNPDTSVAWAALAVAGDNYDLAEANYEQAIRQAPISGTYQLQAAQFYATLGLQTCDEGRRHAVAAFDSPADQPARLLAAELALRCGDPAAVAGALAPLLERSPGDPRLRYLRGAAAWRLGRRDEASADLIYAADQLPGSQTMRDAEALLGPP